MPFTSGILILAKARVMHNMLSLLNTFFIVFDCGFSGFVHQISYVTALTSGQIQGSSRVFFLYLLVHLTQAGSH